MNWDNPIDIPTEHPVRMHIQESFFPKELDDFLPHGWGNGYIRLPKGHMLYGVNYDEIPYYVPFGLSYSAEEQWNGEDYWVIGFDTAHYGNNKYHDKDWVIAETKKLQLQAMKILIIE